MANHVSLPLCERVPRKNTVPRAVELIILLLLLSLLGYRLLSLKNTGFPWLVALLCESWFTLIWVLAVNAKWNQLDYKAYPERLLQWAAELPSVDIFVTTADPVLEPPLITVNTVLSLLAVDYPANKLACYVSDDGCSFLTFYSLVEATKFAQIWVPFCKKYNVSVRAPFRYFNGETTLSKETSHEFQQEWKMIKDEYEKLCLKIEAAAHQHVQCNLTGEFAIFSNIERKNHPTIIKVLWENKETLPDGLPHLVYISREKGPKHPHRFKAGAMNVLTRISGVMTNAPFMLNLDCDMYVNNPQIFLQAMCLMLGVKNEIDSAFVQFPQAFYDGLKDDPYGNQMVVLLEYIGRGIVGIQGPFYQGTGCFHRRKVIYGLSPDDKDINRKLSDAALQKTFGKSIKLIKSAAQTLSAGSTVKSSNESNLVSSLEAAYQVASCGYEYGTSWGTKIGWMYGSTAEDAHTGLSIHGRGWVSTYCSPDPPAFLGCSPSDGPTAMIQQKRWATGLFEIIFTRESPLLAIFTARLLFRQCLAYLFILLWAVRSVPEICYAILPACCLITNSSFMPKVYEPAFLIPAALYVIYNLYTLWEYIRAGQSIRAWWNNQRMWKIYCMTAWLFGLLSAVLKLLGLSDTVFEVTKKDQKPSLDDTNNANRGRFTFDESPVFVPGTTVLLVNLMALIVGLSGLQPLARNGKESGLGEFICSMSVVIYFWAFLRGLFSKGKYGIPSSTICKAGVLTLLFVHFCRWTTVG